MKNLILSTILSTVLLASCSQDNSKNIMVIKGEVKGLKKGTLFLQKIENGTLSTVDSIYLEGTGLYSLKSKINASELHFLSLNKNNEKTIPFFGEPGEITINTNLDRFVFHAKISGSKNQEILDQYNEISSQFQYQNLEMLKENFEAQKEKNQEKIDKLVTKSKNLLRRKYLYTTNFALNNSDSEVAPYIALTQLSDANIKLLDTINNSLTEKIKNSSYGKELNSFIEKIKADEVKE
ncbi:DUF4369 domain-containing protein [Flavicella sp.]|uniref:DUF4369 domain-containing protein n=1 Tax=Flavicella sp. TaxID=2957742 RepID=UPI003018F14A